MQDIVKKMKFRGDPIVLHAPSSIEKELSALGFKTKFDLKEKSKNTLVFISSEKDLLLFLSKNLNEVEVDSVLWFAYPKLSSKIKTDINRDTIRETAEKFGITTVTAIAIDETWSALRFRPVERVGK